MIIFQSIDARLSRTKHNGLHALFGDYRENTTKLEDQHWESTQTVVLNEGVPLRKTKHIVVREIKHGANGSQNLDENRSLRPNEHGLRFLNYFLS